MPYPYCQPHSDHQGRHDVYIAIFDPVNKYGKWTRNLYSQQSKYNKPSHFLEHQADHLGTHYNYTKDTGAVEYHSHCFFNTQDGLIGLCPPSARKDDLMVILQPTPRKRNARVRILRRRVGYFTWENFRRLFQHQNA